MRKAIKDHLRDFIAIGALLVAGLLVTVYILSQQQQPYPSWIPILGDDRFELKAELSTAQAVTPGQGQTVNIAGVKVGDISDVELKDGKAVVTMLIEQQYAPILRSDSTVLLRPRTGLQDMTLEIEAGHKGEPLADGATIPLSQTEPNVQPDQILATLDGDTRAYLQLLLQGAGEGLGGHGKELSATFRRFEPLSRDLAKIGEALAVRRENIKRAITTFKLVSEELGANDTRLAEFVDSSASALGAFANEEASIRESLQELPSTLTETRSALESSEQFSKVLGPASTALIPSARALGPALRAVRPLFENTTPVLQNQLRPFSRAAQTPARHLKQAAKPLETTTKGLKGTFTELETLGNALGYNPPGSAEEGYSFWVPWLNHNINATFYSQDAMGPLFRTVVMFGCSTAGLAEGVATPRPFLRTLQQMTNVPKSSDPQVCPPL
ncbi:MAG: MlaD family protein [Vicinamibacteria bacterium]|jgi:phospholipid/cholesterol/gamma-HCH transport system substrate-binding protein